MLYVISDTHFNHKNIAKYCDRPEDHEELMWDGLSVIKPDDVLIHLGDVAMGRKEDKFNICERLPNCKKILIAGNHDYSTVDWPGWHVVVKYKTPSQMSFEGKIFSLCHRKEQLEHLMGHFYLFGHTHNKFCRKLVDINGSVWYNMCVEQWNYKPVSIEDLYNGI